MQQLDRIKLTPEHRSHYEHDGFLVFEHLLSNDEIDAFLAHESSKSGTSDAGLLSHVVDAQWKYLATHPNVAGVAEQLLDGAPRIVQSMYMPKKAGEGEVGVALHQDTLYLPNEPNTLMACWIAMSDTGPGNGGLCIGPGSHLTGLRTAHKGGEGEHSSWTKTHLMRDRTGKEWEQEFFSFEIDDIDPSSLLKLEVPKGGGVCFNGMTIHGSFANRSDADRLAFAVHYVKEGTWVLRADVQETMAVN
jgi:ectoine hydroxylase-related dioxygenase (phytanoyl-CoA dioxygenase family)